MSEVSEVCFSERQPRRDKNKELNAAELEAIKWVSYGKRISEISEILSKSETSLHYYLNTAKDKLGAQTHAGLVGIALRRGIIK